MGKSYCETSFKVIEAEGGCGRDDEFPPSFVPSLLCSQWRFTEHLLILKNVDDNVTVLRCCKNLK